MIFLLNRGRFDFLLQQSLFLAHQAVLVEYAIAEATKDLALRVEHLRRAVTLRATSHLPREPHSKVELILLLVVKGGALIALPRL